MKLQVAGGSRSPLGILMVIVAFLVAAASGVLILVLLTPIPGTIFLQPNVSGTIRAFPEWGLLERAPVGDSVQSSYFRTTAENREFDRGFAEFTIPSFDGAVSAQLLLNETRAQITAPVPADIHQLSYYRPADLVVDTQDYDRAMTQFETFETDPNLEPQRFSLDIAPLISGGRSGTIGFRVKLAVDPSYSAMGGLGSSFFVQIALTPSRGASTHLPAASAPSAIATVVRVASKP